MQMPIKVHYERDRNFKASNPEKATLDLECLANNNVYVYFSLIPEFVASLQSSHGFIVLVTPLVGGPQKHEVSWCLTHTVSF